MFGYGNTDHSLDNGALLLKTSLTDPPMHLRDLDYDLPPQSIAQTPAEQRDHSRLLFAPKTPGPSRHLRFDAITTLLQPGDVLVVNDTRVLPARLFGVRELTGGKCEVLLIPGAPAPDGSSWRALVRTRGKLQVGEQLSLAEGTLQLELVDRHGRGLYSVRATGTTSIENAMATHGIMPLPPYIERRAATPSQAAFDRERYQTVFARDEGAVAAPTAGLHFTPPLLAELAEGGVIVVPITLRVGLGTFRPLTAEDPLQHAMHAETYACTAETWAAITKAKAEGRRVIACGTTAVRTLEAIAQTEVLAGQTDLYLYPPYAFRVVDGMITNFHLPRSTLQLLVAAMIGLERLHAIYREALAHEYRFYSYGDAMVIL